MANRHKWILGNWKMNPASLHEVQQFCEQFHTLVPTALPHVQVGLAPTFIHLPCLQQQQQALELPFFLLAQNCAQYSHTGAHTGEVSASQLKDSGVLWVIIGHSERRADQQESDRCIGEKVDHALKAGINVVICVGETLAERQAGEAEAVVTRQLDSALQASEFKLWPERVLVAYEPVWAIGTGMAASAEDAQNMHAAIRQHLTNSFAPLAETPLLYGGSVKPENASELIKQKDIDGFLVGGASLDPASFARIIQATTH